MGFEKGKPGPWKGRKFSEEHRRKLSEAHKGLVPWNKGKHHSEETRRKVSESLKGKCPSEETRRKMSETRKGRKRPPFSEEWKKNISIAKKGQIPWITGRCHTAESRKKMSKAHKDKPLSEEHRQRIAESRRRGPDHWGWKGGHKPYYGPNWNRQRILARQRDNGICWNCREKEEGRRHHIHHIVPFRVFGLERHEEANELKNLMTLCARCHKRLEVITISADEMR